MSKFYLRFLSLRSAVALASCLFALALTVFLCFLPKPPSSVELLLPVEQEPKPDRSEPLTEEEAFVVLSGKNLGERDGNFDISPGQRLRNLGPRLFPILLHTLESDTASERARRNALSLLCQFNTDRSVFRECTFRSFLNEEPGVRHGALALAVQIGSTFDSPVFVALLTDPDFLVTTAASFVLQQLGEESELTALKLWLRPGHWHFDSDSTKNAIANCIELDRRLLGCKRTPNGESLKWLPHPDSALAVLGGLGYSKDREFAALRMQTRRLVLAAMQSDTVSDESIKEAFNTLAQLPGDRKEFALPVLKKLTSDSPAIRLGAIQLISQIGTARETSPMHALLLDDDETVKYAAAKCIREIGGKRDVLALDLWLRSGHWHNDKKHKDFVRECREALDKRLKAAELKAESQK